MFRLARRPGRVAGATTAGSPGPGARRHQRRPVPRHPAARRRARPPTSSPGPSCPASTRCSAGRRPPAVTDVLWIGGRIVVAIDALGVAFSDDNGATFTWLNGCGPLPAPAVNIQGLQQPVAGAGHQHALRPDRAPAAAPPPPPPADTAGGHARALPGRRHHRRRPRPRSRSAAYRADAVGDPARLRPGDRDGPGRRHRPGLPRRLHRAGAARSGWPACTASTSAPARRWCRRPGSPAPVPRHRRRRRRRPPAPATAPTRPA